VARSCKTGRRAGAEEEWECDFGKIKDKSDALSEVEGDKDKSGKE